jgi:hypothetical protein
MRGISSVSSALGTERLDVRLEQLFDLLDQESQVGLRERELGCGDTVVFDVRGDVFVMWVSGG